MLGCFENNFKLSTAKLQSGIETDGMLHQGPFSILIGVSGGTTWNTFPLISRLAQFFNLSKFGGKMLGMK